MDSPVLSWHKRFAFNPGTVSGRLQHYRHPMDVYVHASTPLETECFRNAIWRRNAICNARIMLRLKTPV